jgi:tetratricopeptide (TPR) repeat protein
MSLEGYHSMRTHVMVRFGRWQDIINESLPDDPNLYPMTTAMHHYAKAVAQATLGNFDVADRERALFGENMHRIPLERKVFNNSAHSILSVAEKMLDGELAYHRGNYQSAFAHLREAVERDDNLEYVEPWAWMHPPRHALAALLAEQGHFAEAERIYRDDLGLTDRIQRCAQHPSNVWALHGLAECLEVRHAVEELELIRPELEAAMALTDVPITSSCMCRIGLVEKSSGGCCQ